MRSWPKFASVLFACWLLSAGSAQAHDHSLGFGYRYGHLNTSTDQVFDFHSPTVQYAVSIGGWLRFFGVLEIMIPTLGVQGGEHYDLNSTYESKFGADVSFGALLHFEPLERLFVQTGIGPHMNAMTLSNVELVTFNSLTLGITSYTTARFAITDVIETGANLVVSFDFADPIHTAYGLDWGMHFAITALIGVRLGEGDSPSLSPTLEERPPVRREDPAAEEDANEPANDTDAADSAGDDPATNEPATDEPAADEPAADEPATDDATDADPATTEAP